MQILFAVLQDMFVMPEAPDSCQLVHPPPLSILQKSGAVDSDEDFPLPPPPEDLLYPMEGQSQGQSCRESPYQRGSSNTLPAQTNVMQHLNSALLAPRRSSKQDSDPNRASNWSDKSSGYSASGDADDEDDYSFARQLKGVHLKRAESRDRSAPRLPKLWITSCVVIQVSSKLWRMPRLVHLSWKPMTDWARCLILGTSSVSYGGLISLPDVLSCLPSNPSGIWTCNLLVNSLKHKFSQTSVQAVM